MALIALIAVAAPLPAPLSYRVPDSLRAAVRIGVRVRVPLGRRQATGYVLELAAEVADPQLPLRELLAVLDQQPLADPGLLAFLRRAAAYYLHPPGEVIRTALPAGLSGGGGDVAIRRDTVYAPGARAGEPAGRVQQALLAAVREAGELPLGELRARFPAPHAPLRRLVAEGFLSATQRECYRDPFRALPTLPDLPPRLHAPQAAALDRILAALHSAEFRTLLLFGVTGSGKTEVYLRAIAEVLAAGRQALVLVPEIALTPQLVARFRARFEDKGARIAVLHSGLSDGERYDAWRAIARGEAAIVIGARSAVFAPLERLGLVVVDEEHEGSYKQTEGFRYHARDLALMRAQMAGIPALLGSATPAVTTFQRASEGQVELLELSDRVAGRALPEVELIDLIASPSAGPLSAPLIAALEQTLAAGEQALLLLNRRGFSPFLLCADCGQTFRCPNCAITLTFHLGERRLRCHYCDFWQRPPEDCPRCGGHRLSPEGTGTERLEQELAALLPAARIARMDRDTTARKGGHADLVGRMERREIDILVGTQMVAKGLDFPGVTLVGVLAADASLNLPDFRSAERTFTLLTQVAGRAGRGERPGRVLVQTTCPQHYALECASRHDYRGFFAAEIAFRRELGYPPFGFLVNLVLAGNEAERVGRAAAALAGSIRVPAGVELLGPAPCVLAKLRGKTRMQLLLKAARREPLRRVLGQEPAWRKALPAGVQLAVDVDPVDML